MTTTKENGLSYARTEEVFNKYLLVISSNKIMVCIGIKQPSKLGLIKATKK